MDSTLSLKDFQSLRSTSIIDPGLDDVPLSDDDNASITKEIWEEIVTNDPNEDAAVAFKELFDLLKNISKGFWCKLINDHT